MSSESTFWTIPPIQDAIFNNLTPHDLATCTRVSRSFHTWTTPFLWSKVDVQWGRGNLFFESGGLKNNHQYVNALYVRHNSGDMLQLTTSHGPAIFPQLATLMTGILKTVQEFMNLLEFVASHKNLRIFTLEVPSTVPECMDSLMPTIINHPMLQRLELQFHGISWRDFIRLLQGCTRLEMLLVSSFPFSAEPAHQAGLVPQAGIEGDVFLQEFSLQELGLNLSDVWANSLVPLLLKSCPKLLRFSWECSMFPTAEAAQGLGHVLQEHCPQLVGVQLREKERSHYTDLAIKNLKGLQAISLPLCRPSTRGVVTILQHAQTLESLTLVCGEGISFGSFLTIVHKCGRLNDFVVRLDMGLDLEESREEQDRLLTGPWACSKLQKIKFYIPKHVVVNLVNTKRLSRLFRNLGKLKEMRWMGFILFENDSELATALMERSIRLTGLVQLRLFQLRVNLEHVKRERFELLVRVWPKLESFLLGVCPGFLKVGGELIVEWKRRWPGLLVEEDKGKFIYQ